ncbi:MAG: glycerate kinase [Planctomycetota bacterium]|nr:glycerate kinase [Planctomycetota bacterium]
MKIVLAPDKFKGCLSAAHIASAMERGGRRADPLAEIDFCPMADGGEGTVEALVAATGGRFEIRRVTGPLAEMKVDARFGILGDGKTAVVEMSAASGLALLKPADRNPIYTTTYGTGELLMAALALGVSKIILGIGGSATVDGGIGVAQACGLPVLLEGGELVSPGEPLTGADIGRVVLIKHGRGSAIEKVTIVVACDVDNPLCGPHGAAVMYGPQKGASPAEVVALDAALHQLAVRNDRLMIANTPGAGAAGGLGFGMAAFFGATLQSGIEIVIEATHLRNRLKGAALCLTGEGRLDEQSLRGKAIAGVASACREAGVPCIAICGSSELDLEQIRAAGLAGVFSLRDKSMTLAAAMNGANELIAHFAEEAVFATIKHAD